MNLLIFAFVTSWIFYCIVMHDLCMRAFSVIQYDTTTFRKVLFYFMMVAIGSNPFVAPFIIGRFEKLIASYE